MASISFDAQCPKCKKRFGWRGDLKTPRTPCPKCGHALPPPSDDRDAEEVEEFREYLRRRAEALPVKAKAEYVRAQGQDRPHHCHWPKCKAQVPPAKFMCYRHWTTLPKYIRDRIWATYRPGQEKTMDPSPAYLAAAEAAQAWIADFLARGEES